MTLLENAKLKCRSTWKWRKGIAVKDHECTVCGALILKGKEYFSEVGLNDGKFFYEKSCISPDICIIDEYNIMRGYGEQVETD